MEKNTKLKNMDFKRTKIVCTIGPASEDEDVIRRMIENGMNVARLNLSHDKLENHLRRLGDIRRIAGELGEHVGVMFDTRGPDIRVGEMENGQAELETDSEFTLTSKPVGGTSERASVSYPGLTGILKPGDAVYLNDGLLELKVVDVGAEEAVCRVVAGGVLKSRKGINVPGKRIPLPVLTESDVEDLREGIKHGIDYISASFVNSPEDISYIRDAIEGSKVPIIAKIESAGAVEKLEGIIDTADALMVARGDLGIEIPPEEVPGVQKRMIRMCRLKRKPVITATEMLESMTRQKRPTRAEITDVANAVLDGTSAVMLSQETAVGMYPVETVAMMSRICCRAEKDLGQVADGIDLILDESDVVREGIADAACHLAEDIKAPAIICVTDSGATAAIFSHMRPSQPVLACTPDACVARMLSLFWGTLPVIVDEQESVEDLLEVAISLGKSRGFISKGDRVVFTGNLSGRVGETNLLATVRAE